MTGRDKLGAWDSHTHSTEYQTDKSQGPGVWHRALNTAITCEGKECGKEWIQVYTHTTESLCCPPETHRTLQINYIPIIFL